MAKMQRSGAIYVVMCGYIVYNIMADSRGGRTCGIFRLTTVYNSMAGMAVYGCCCVYISIQVV